MSSCLTLPWPKPPGPRHLAWPYPDQNHLGHAILPDLTPTKTTWATPSCLTLPRPKLPRPPDLAWPYPDQNHAILPDLTLIGAASTCFTCFHQFSIHCLNIYNCEQWTIKFTCFFLSLLTCCSTLDISRSTLPIDCSRSSLADLAPAAWDLVSSLGRVGEMASTWGLYSGSYKTYKQH